MKGKRTLNALIRLLDDPDPQVYQDVEARILSYGLRIWDDLSQAVYIVPGEVTRCRLQKILETLHLQHTRALLLNWQAGPGNDLLSAMLLMAEHNYPQMDREQVRSHIDIIRKDAWLELNDHLTALEQIKVLNQVFFQIHGFRTAKGGYSGEEHLYINDVLAQKRGNTLIINILYAILAEKLDMPVYMVRLPGRYILAYLDTPYHKHISRDDVLFYFSTDQPGHLWSHQDIGELLSELNITPDKSHFTPCSSDDIMQGVLHMLSEGHRRMNHPGRAKDLQDLSAIFRKA